MVGLLKRGPAQVLAQVSSITDPSSSSILLSGLAPYPELERPCKSPRLAGTSTRQYRPLGRALPRLPRFPFGNAASVPPQRLLEQKSANSKLTATRFRAQSPPVLRSRDELRSSATTMPRAPREASKERSVEALKTYREPFRQPVIPPTRPLPVVGGQPYGCTHSLQQLPQLYVSPSLQSLHGY